jgi:hypothetical protein
MVLDELLRQPVTKIVAIAIEDDTGRVPAVSTPDHVAPDPSFEDRKRYYARDVGPSRWLLVIVSYEQTPARIVSVFANRKDPKSWSA